MKTLFILLIVCSASWAGQETQNGAGAAEHNFAYALTLLKPVYKMCLDSDLCLRDDLQRNILKMIYGNMEEELKNPIPLQYRPDSDPGFSRDGAGRIAYTGLIVGDPIYINQDLIYKNVNGINYPYSVSEAIAVLTHEYGHHVPLMGHHDLLAAIGANVRAFFEMKSDRVVFDNFLSTIGDTNVSMSVFHPSLKADEGPSYFWLNVDDEVYDLNAEVVRQVKCHPPVPGTFSELASFRFGRFHWGDSFIDMEPRSQVVYPLHSHLLIKCRAQGASSPGYSQHFVATFYIYFKQTTVNLRLRLKYIEKVRIEIKPL